MKAKLNIPTTQLEQMQLMKIKLDNQNFKKQQFTAREISMFEMFCQMLGYHFSINPHKQTIKIFNEKTFRFGYIQKLNGQYWYGYIKKLNGSSNFIKKYPITDNLTVFTEIAKVHCNNIIRSEDKNTVSYEYTNKIKDLSANFLKLFCGIIELEFVK